MFEKIMKAVDKVIDRIVEKEGQKGLFEATWMTTAVFGGLAGCLMLTIGELYYAIMIGETEYYNIIDKAYPWFRGLGVMPYKVEVVMSAIAVVIVLVALALSIVALTELIYRSQSYFSGANQATE